MFKTWFFLFTEGHPDASKQAEAIKKARVGYINLKAYLNQVDCIEFATALRNEFLFAVGSAEGFGPWLDQAEERIKVNLLWYFVRHYAEIGRQLLFYKS